MKFFVDTADIKQIEGLLPTGFVDGVTTNPSLIAKQGKDMKEIIQAICSLVEGPVSVEVTAKDHVLMLKEGEYLASIAENIDKNNTRRVIRGFEVGRSGFQLENHQKERNFTKFQVYGLTMDRELLYEKIDNRIEAMFKKGWVEEVQNLISIGLNNKSLSFKNIGYTDIYLFIKKEISFEEVLIRIKKSTRNLIRHQYNWFKLSDPRIKWIDISGKNNNNYALNIILEDFK